MRTLRLALCLMLALLAFSARAEEECVGFARVLMDRVNLRESPGGDRILYLDEGSYVFVHGERMDENGNIWYAVRAPKGQAPLGGEGYVRGDMLTLSRDVFVNLVDVALEYHYIVGLQADGHAVAMGRTIAYPNGQSPYDVGGWTDIVSVAIGEDTTYGLRSDGDIVSTGKYGRKFMLQESVPGMQLIVDDVQMIGLLEDGSLVTNGATAWSQYIPEGETLPLLRTLRICSGDVAGITLDGGVFRFGANQYGQCDLNAAWAGVVDIRIGCFHTVGLKAGGTVVAVGLNRWGQCDVEGWTDITALVVGPYHTVGLKADGTVVATGLNDSKQCEVEGLRGITKIYASRFFTVGLRADGTLAWRGGFGEGDTSEVYLVEHEAIKALSAPMLELHPETLKWFDAEDIVNCQ